MSRADQVRDVLGALTVLGMIAACIPLGVTYGLAVFAVKLAENRATVRASRARRPSGARAVSRPPAT